MGLFYTYNTSVDKAYIIRIKNHELSENLAKRCCESCEKVGMPYEFWDAYNGLGEEIIFPSNHNLIMDMMKITNHHLTKQEICCLLSHVSLWAKCILIDKPIVVLEHDAIMAQPYLNHGMYNSISYLGCAEQVNGWKMYPTPPHGTDGPNNHFILRTHAYAIDPAVAKNLLSHAIKYGLHTSADKFIRADIFPMHQAGGYAFDGQSETTIEKRAEHNYKTTRIDEIKVSDISDTGYWNGKTAHDHHAHSPELACWIYNFLKSKNQTDVQIYDFGCGLGNYLEKLKENGFDKLTGYEAEIPDKKVFENIKKYDLTIPIDLPIKGNILSLEVGEHIPIQYMDVYINNISNNCKKYLILSWAMPDQPGHGHVNCLENKEVITILEQKGFKLLSSETSNARSVIKDDCYWFKNTLLIFEKI
jgi:hypothetical protein